MIVETHGCKVDVSEEEIQEQLKTRRGFDHEVGRRIIAYDLAVKYINANWAAKRAAQAAKIAVIRARLAEGFLPLARKEAATARRRAFQRAVDERLETLVEAGLRATLAKENESGGVQE